MNKLIKNYTTEIPLEKTIAEIQSILSKNGARGIMFDYSDTGLLKAIFFRIKYKDRELPFRLPANPEGVYNALFKGKQGEWKWGKQRRESADKISWRIVKSWLEAQITLVNLEQAKMEQVFLPYLVVGQNQTLFEHMESNQMLLPSPTQ